MLRKVTILTLTVLLLLVPLTVAFGKAPVVDAQIKDPVEFVVSYMTAQMEALLHEKPELIDPFFNAESKISNYTLTFETLRLKYVIEHFAQGCGGISWYSPDIKAWIVNEGRETVVVRALYSGFVHFIDSDSPELFNDNEPHDIFLRKHKAGNWYVETAEYVDLFVRTYGRVPIEDFPQIFAEQKEQWERHRNIIFEAVPERPTVQAGKYETASGSYTLTMLDRQKVVDYCEKYTESGGFSNDKYNKNFLYATYNGANADCQNFVSQALWYGFGGIDTNPVSTGQPMVKDVIGASNWFATSTGASTPWVSTSTFNRTIEDNYYSVKHGVSGYRTPNNSTGALLVGDLVTETTDFATRGHAMIITRIVDNAPLGVQTWTDLYISAHNENQLHRRLYGLYGNETNLKYLYVVYHRKPG